jgi:nitrite reductase/ring-hydroxylating ferredoxin subunit
MVWAQLSIVAKAVKSDKPSVAVAPRPHLAGRRAKGHHGVFSGALCMSDFVTVAKVGAISEGRGEAFAVNGRMVAVFCINGQYQAMDDICPHMGASLGSGEVVNGIVTCPWHAWRFRVCDGTWCDNPRLKLDTFEVRVQGDEIQVRVPDK